MEVEKIINEITTELNTIQKSINKIFCLEKEILELGLQKSRTTKTEPEKTPPTQPQKENDDIIYTAYPTYAVVKMKQVLDDVEMDEEKGWAVIMKRWSSENGYFWNYKVIARFNNLKKLKLYLLKTFNSPFYYMKELATLRVINDITYEPTRYT